MRKGSVSVYCDTCVSERELSEYVMITSVCVGGSCIGQEASISTWCSRWRAQVLREENATQITRTNGRAFNRPPRQNRRPRLQAGAERHRRPRCIL